MFMAIGVQMASIFLYPKIKIEELDVILEKTIKDVSLWFTQNPKRKVCRASWIHGESFKIRKNHIKQDIEKMCIKTKLDMFKNKI